MRYGISVQGGGGILQGGERVLKLEKDVSDGV